MSDNKVQSFFPGERKKMQMRAQGSGPLKDATGMRRIRLAVKMSLDDGKLKGMPDWIGDSFALVAKENGPTDRSPITRVQLDGVNCEIFTTEQTAEPSMLLSNCNLSAFVLTRGKEKKSGEMAAVDLHFTLKTSGWIPQLWTWIGDNLDAVFCMRFAGTQISLTFKNPAAAEDESEDGEDPEDEEQGALIIASDFGKEAEAKPAPKPALSFNSKSSARKAAEAAMGGRTVN